MHGEIGIHAAAYQAPSRSLDLSTIFAEEGRTLSERHAERLGVTKIRVCRDETGSELALAAAQEAIRQAGIAANDIGVIVDYSVLPQEFLVPAWNMSNKLQHQVGAKNSFTVGFSGAGATGFLVSLQFAASLMAVDPTVHAALLLAADRAIPRNRLLDAEEPVTILGDGASAMVLTRTATRGRIMDVELWSDGEFHDVCYIPGGAMKHPRDVDRYRLTLDRAKYEASARWHHLRSVAGRVLDRAGLSLDGITRVLYPELSREDRATFARAFELRPDQLAPSNRHRYGHVFGSGFVADYLSLQEEGSVRVGDPVLMVSHGLGFTYGAALLRF